MTDSATSAIDATTTAASIDPSIDPWVAAIEKPTTVDAPAEETPVAEADPAKAETATEESKAPETYQDFTLPDGNEIAPETLEEFKQAALGAKLTQEQAQHLVDMGSKMSAQITQQAWDTHNAKVADWQEQAKSDKEYGGDKLHENLALASKAMDAFATPELKQVLDQTGLGNHPELIRAFVRVGRQISEDKLVSGGSMPVGDSRSIAERLYPN